MNKTLRDALLAQIRHAEYGVPETVTTSFKNMTAIDADGTETKFQPPCNMLLVMKNQPAYARQGQPITIKTDELVRLQAGLELDEIKEADRAGMLAGDREQLEWLESQSILEYQADLQILYGNLDHLTPAEAMAHPGLKRIGNEIEEWIAAGVMDIVDTTPDESGAVRDPRARRPNLQRINLEWIRRALTKNSPCDRAPGNVGYFDDRFDDKGNEVFARRFIRFTGTANLSLQGGGGSFITHLVFGRTPEPNAKRYSPNKRPRGRVGQNGRGFLIIMRLQEPMHAITTWMDLLMPEQPGTDNPISQLMNEYVEGLPDLLPGLDDAQLDALVKSLDALAGRMEKAVRVSKFVGWLEDHPTNTSIIRNMKLLVEEKVEQAEAATGEPEVDPDFMAALAAMNAAAPIEGTATEEPKVEAKPEDAATKPVEETAPAVTKPPRKRAPRAKKAKVEAAPEAAPVEAPPATPPTPTPAPEASA